MKKIYFTLAITTILMVGFLLTACNSKGTKMKENQTKVEEKDKLQIEVNAEEWKAFKNDFELQIQNNEQKIAELKIRIKNSGEVLDQFREKRIAAYEQANRDLKARLASYEISQSNWEQFKSEFQRDMNEIKESFGDLTEDNV